MGDLFVAWLNNSVIEYTAGALHATFTISSRADGDGQGRTRG
jgi:hypothetical protein